MTKRRGGASPVSSPLVVERALASPPFTVRIGSAMMTTRILLLIAVVLFVVSAATVAGMALPVIDTFNRFRIWYLLPEWTTPKLGLAAAVACCAAGVVAAWLRRRGLATGLAMAAAVFGILSGLFFEAIMARGVSYWCACEQPLEPGYLTFLHAQNLTAAAIGFLCAAVVLAVTAWRR